MNMISVGYTSEKMLYESSFFLSAGKNRQLILLCLQGVD